MGVFVFQEFSTNPDAETGLNAVANVPLMKKKINVKETILFMLSKKRVCLFSRIKLFVNTRFGRKKLFELFVGVYCLSVYLAENAHT